MASNAGKGSAPRPFTVPTQQFDSNWDAIFKKSEKQLLPATTSTTKTKTKS